MTIAIVKDENGNVLYKGTKFGCIHFLNVENTKGRPVKKWTIGTKSQKDLLAN